jgi:hypothetical protein
MRSIPFMAIALFALVFAAMSSAPLGARQKSGPNPRGGAPAPARAGGALSIDTTLTATSANVSQSGTPVKIQILKWSADEDRNKIVAAFTAPARSGGAPASAAPAATPPAADAAGGDAAAGGGARAAGAGRGGGRGGRGGRDQAPPLTPEQRLAAALAAAPTVGYVWTNDVTGYSIKYAQRLSDKGGQRIILATDRRLGMYNAAWKPTGSATPPDYDFTVIELRLDARGAGEGKTSLTGKVVVDPEAQGLALEDYVGAPVHLRNVKRQTGS